MKPLILMAAALAVASINPAKADQLTGAVLFSSTSSGAGCCGIEWATKPNGVFDLFISSDATANHFLNGPTDALSGINIGMVPGTTTYYIWGEPGSLNPNFAMNLFFNGAILPGISVTGATNNPASLAASGASASIGFDLGSHPAAGTLTYFGSSTKVTLTSFSWYDPASALVPIADTVGPHSTGASGQNDFRGSFTLTVEQVPEPGTSGMLGAGLAALFFARRNR